MTEKETEQPKKAEPRTLHELTVMASTIEDFFMDRKLRIEERQYIVSLLQASTSANFAMRMFKSSIPKMKIEIAGLRPKKVPNPNDN